MADQPAPRLTLGDLANRVLAADSGERARLLAQLARGARAAEQISAIAERFLGGGKVGQRVFLEWVTRIRGEVPPAVLTQARSLIADRSIPVNVRVAATARVLRATPDTPESVRAVIRPLMAGLSPLRGLERLRQLEHHLEKSRGLDALIERRERRVKLDCPRCGVRLRRMEMVRHLWFEHGMLLERGKVRGAERQVAELVEEYTKSHDTSALDRAALLTDPPALRAWAADSDPSAEDTALLLNQAEGRQAGLCPGCFSELPEAVPPLPPPLTLSRGRIAGDGYVVEVGGAEWFRTLTVASPTAVFRSGPDRGQLLGPRGAASLAAGVVALATIATAALISPTVVNPLTLVFRAVLGAALLYGVVYFFRKPLLPPTERAINAAWTVLARRVLRKASGSAAVTRFLTRLCRTSFGRGDPVERAGVLGQIVDKAAAVSNDSVPDLELLAAASVLQVDDAARHGRDRVAGIAGVAAAGFRDERLFEFAEYVTSCFLDRKPGPEAGELGRLRTLLLAAAFDAGIKPRLLVDLWAVAPNLRRAMAVEPLHRLGLLYGLWSIRPSRQWERVAPADAVFDLCRVAPNISGRLLVAFPDLLLHHRPDPAVEEELGPVLVCCRGVVVGGMMASDPDSRIEVVKGGMFGGGYELLYGPHRLRLSRRPPQDFVETVRAWLRFRATALLPYIDSYLTPASPAVVDRVLAPFSLRCRRCGVISAVAVGKVGTPRGAKGRP